MLDPIVSIGQSILVSRTSCEQQPMNVTVRPRDTDFHQSDRTISPSKKTAGILIELGISVGLSLLVGLTVRYLMSAISDIMNMDERREDRPNPSIVERRLRNILSKREGKEGDNNSRNLTLPTLNSYELQIAQVIIDPDDVDISFGDIGGLDKTKEEIYELAILPLVEPELFQGKLVQPCRGILLYGKPGTGKTMLAKALAKEAAAVFVPLQLSTILNKYLGESNKMVAATFTLARKLAPAIIFIDELDTFLKANTAETAYLDTIKSEFLTWWDGVGTSDNTQVLVLGATNRPENIDPAILRRMPRAFAVPLPDEAGRKAILSLLFRDESLEKEARDYISKLARLTLGYSGSDLKELAKAAAMVAVQERSSEFAMRRVMGQGSTKSRDILHEQRKKPLRPMTVADLKMALDKVKKTGEVAKAYGAQSAAEEARDDLVTNNDASSLRHLTHLLRSISRLSENYPNTSSFPNDVSNDEAGEDDVPDL